MPEKRKEKTEAKKFHLAMDRLLKVPPQIVKAAMEQEKMERAHERKTKKAGKSK